jgi:hypothetical protein
MVQHVRGKLGPAARGELVRLIVEDAFSERAAAADLSVAPKTAHHQKVRWLEASTEARARPAAGRSIVQFGPTARRIGPTRRQRAGLRGAAQDGLGAAIDRRRDRGAALDRPRHPAPPRLLAAAAVRARPGRALRVALPGRFAAHGRQALSALPSARPRGHR